LTGSLYAPRYYALLEEDAVALARDLCETTFLVPESVTAYDVPDTRDGFVGESSACKEVQKPPLKGTRGIWKERQLGSPTAKKTAKLADKGA